MSNEAFYVAISRDDVVMYDVDHLHARGTYEQCCKFIAAHLPPRGYEFEIVSGTTGRLMSYYLEGLSRRTRLTIQDCKTHCEEA